MSSLPTLAHDVSHAAELLRGCTFVSAEFMYQPRPTDPRTRRVFDYALRSRLGELNGSGVLLLCADDATLHSLLPVLADYPQVRQVALIVNPQPAAATPSRSPYTLGWEQPHTWRRYQTTDRWARIEAALGVGAALGSGGWLAMPAQDAVWGRTLLVRLVELAHQHAQNGHPAAVSPYTPYQHSQVRGANIPRAVIALVNVAFNRDAMFAQQLDQDALQSFWGKMSLMPFTLCADVNAHTEKRIWEDDLEIDRVLRACGYGVRARWMASSRLYRQALPVFDEQGVQRIFERTLHYSLNVSLRGSLLHAPHTATVPARRDAAAVARAQALIDACTDAIDARIRHFGASWVDWGRYRHVIEPHNPFVEVWRQEA